MAELRPDDEQGTTRLVLPTQHGVAVQRAVAEIRAFLRAGMRDERVGARPSQLLEVGVLARTNKRLDIELQAQVAAEEDVGPRRQIEGLVV